MLRKQLKDIASVTTGYTFRSGIKSTSGDKLKVLQAKNIRGPLVVAKEDFDITGVQAYNKNALINPGDVVITSRGKFQAAVVETNEQILASSSVFIIRPNYTEIDSYYLAIYLNSLPAQKTLLQLATGGSIRSLLRIHLESLLIPIPYIEKQKTITKLYLNIEQQQTVLNHMSNTLNNIFESSLFNILNN